jgi:Zn-dependent metalloprotease
MNKKLITTLVLSSLVASAFAVNAGAATDKQVLKDEKGQVHNVAGKLGTVSGATAEARALAALDKVSADFGFAKAAGNFKSKNSHADENGVTHTKLDQVINGIPVLNHEMIVHEQNGAVQGVTGDFRERNRESNRCYRFHRQAVPSGYCEIDLRCSRQQSSSRIQRKRCVPWQHAGQLANPRERC